MIAPDAPFVGSDNLTVTDFWRWAFSDLLSNATRGIVAEFVVAAALDVRDRPRLEWNSYDLAYKGHEIEVKSAAYLQSWDQTSPSRIRFDVATRSATWNHESNAWVKTDGRTASAYVFCLFAETSPERANVLDLNQWEFYVVSTGRLNREIGDQKSVGLRRLAEFVRPVPYLSIRDAVDEVIVGTR